MQQIKVTLQTPITEIELARVTNAANLCFIKNYEPTNKFNPKLFTELIKLKHFAPLEFLDFTIFIQGISRVAALQIVRHRTFSWMSSSFQYQKANNFDYVIPNGLQETELLAYKTYMEQARNLYINLEKTIGRDNARYTIPTAARTDMFMKGNFRNLMHFINLRICRRNTEEVQILCQKIVSVFPKMLQQFLTASCCHGTCDQGSMSCGKPFKMEDLL